MKDHHDLRKTPRMPQREHMSTRFTIVKENVRIDKMVDLEMLDLNFQGMGVLTEVPLDVDSLINFDVFFDGVRYNITTRVLWTSKTEDRYRSGLHFEDVPMEMIDNIKIYLAEFVQRKYHN